MVSVYFRGAKTERRGGGGWLESTRIGCGPGCAGGAARTSVPSGPQRWGGAGSRDPWRPVPSLRLVTSAPALLVSSAPPAPRPPQVVR